MVGVRAEGIGVRVGGGNPPSFFGPGVPDRGQGWTGLRAWEE